MSAGAAGAEGGPQPTPQFMEATVAGIEAAHAECTRLREELAQAHAEMQRTRGDFQAQVAALRAEFTPVQGGGVQPRKANFDDRKLKVEPYTGEKPTWPDFAWTIGGFVNRESAELKAAMDKTERGEEEIDRNKLVTLGITPELDGELMWLLMNHTKSESTAKNFLRANQHRTGLEVWRRFWRDAMPKGGAQETVSIQKLMHPNKAKNYREFQKLLLEWDTKLAEEDRRCDTGEALAPRFKAMALLWMMPSDLELEVLKKDKDTRENYDKLRAICEDSIFIHTSGMAPTTMVNALELGGGDDESELEEVFYVDPATGQTEVYMIAKKEWTQVRRRGAERTARAGQQQPPRKPAPSGGGGVAASGQTASGGKPIRECWRCGRTNHVKADCRAKTKVDGTPLPDNPPKSQVHHVEGAEGMELHSVELNVCEQWGNVELPPDPWMMGSDPWQQGAGSAELLPSLMVENVGPRHRSSFTLCQPCSVEPQGGFDQAVVNLRAAYAQVKEQMQRQHSPQQRCQQSLPVKINDPFQEKSYEILARLRRAAKQGTEGSGDSCARRSASPEPDELPVPQWCRPYATQRNKPYADMHLVEAESLTDQCYDAEPDEEDMNPIEERGSWFLMRWLMCILSALAWVIDQGRRDTSRIGKDGDPEPDEEEVTDSKMEEVIELNVVDASATKKTTIRKITQGVLVDSGAGVTIADGGKEFPEYALEPSDASRAGQTYAGAGAETIRNRGQRKVRIRLGSEGGPAANIKFQDAAVRRPILSVGESTEAGNLILFDQEASVIIPRGSPAIEEIRQIVRKAGNKLSMRKERNIFMMDAWVETKSTDDENLFGR